MAYTAHSNSKYDRIKEIKKIKDGAYYAAITCESHGCPLFSRCSQFASMGKKTSRTPIKLFFVFDAPDQGDVNEGVAAVSDAGMYFRKNWLNPFIQLVGATSYLITHLVRTPIVDAKNSPRAALASEAAYCWEHFWRDMMEYKPKALIVFGPQVFQQLYQKAINKEVLPDAEAQNIIKLRKNSYKMQFTADYSVAVFVGYAPSYILRSPNSKHLFTEDMNHVVNYISPGKMDLSKQKIEIDKIDLIDTVDGALDFIDFLTRGLPQNEMFDLAFDTETDDLNRVFNNKFLSWQFSYKPGHAVFIPIEHPEKPIFADIKIKLKLIAAFQNLLNSSPEQTRIAWIVAHNAKFDLSVLYGLYRILPRGSIPIWDTLLAMHWLDENRKSVAAGTSAKPYSLKTLGKEFFSLKNEQGNWVDFEYKSEALAARADGDLVNLSFDALVEYGGTDTILTWHLKQEQMRKAREEQKGNALEKLDRFMRHYYSPASRAIAFMECNGLHVSKEQLQYLQGEESPIWNRIDRIEKIDLQTAPEILDFKDEYKNIILGTNISYEDDLWGNDNTSDSELVFNPNKKDQETPFYLNFLKLTPLALSKKTNKPTLNKEFLNHYAARDEYLTLPSVAPYVSYYTTPLSYDEEGDPVFPKNPLQLILELRELSKLGNTYLAGIGDMIGDKKGDCIDGRVRASYWMSGTDTGRLSSSSPNLQNLPAGRSKMAKEIKNLFQAEPPSKKFPEGTVLLQLDYKTAEVRWAAIFANDQNLIRVFKEARESLIAACAPDSTMSDEEFEATQLASDIHRRTASLMFNVSPKDVSKSMRQASKCLVGSTKLLTNKGIVSISDLVPIKDNDANWCQPLNDVIVSSNKGAVAVRCINHKWVESTIKLDTATGVSIQGDEDHPLLVWHNCEVVERKLKDINEGDFLVISRSNTVWPTESPKIDFTMEEDSADPAEDCSVQCLICGENLGNLTNHLTVKHGVSSAEYRKQFPHSDMVSSAQIAKRMKSLLGTKYNLQVPNSPSKMSPALASVLGYLVAEGDGQKYTMSGNVHKSTEMLQDFLRCFSLCFGLSPKIREYPQITTTGVITVPQKVVRYLFKLGLIKGYSNTQRVPEIIFRSTKKEIIAFLRAYFEGESSVKSNSIVVMSASELLMQDIQYLLLSLNIVSKKFSDEVRTSVGKELRTYYGLMLGIRDSRIFREVVGFISQHKQEQAYAIKSSSGQDSIYGLDQLLKELKRQYKVGDGGLHRYAIDGVSVRFGERISKSGKVEYTHEKLASRPHVLDALRLWSKKEHNLVYESVSWLHQTKSMLVAVSRKTIVEERTKVYDIEVDDPEHIFVANGFLSKNCITFGLLFGMGTQTLAKNNGWTENEAEEKIEMFYSAFPQLRDWLERNPKIAERDGYVETIMGRRRRLHDLYAVENFRTHAKASRLAKNAPIQGQSSDGGNIGLINFFQFLLDNNLEKKWLIQNIVHDSCLVQVPMADLEKALEAMQYHFVEGMADYIKKYFNFTLPLPIECEIEVGLKYGDLTKWDGRPSTLPGVREKLKEDAKKLWSKKEDTGKPPSDFDLIPWCGK